MFHTPQIANVILVSQNVINHVSIWQYLGDALEIKPGLRALNCPKFPFNFITALNGSKLDIRPVKCEELQNIHGLLLEKDCIPTFNAMISCYKYDPEGMLAAVKEDGEIIGEDITLLYWYGSGTRSGS